LIEPLLCLRKYYINDYYQYDNGAYYYQPPYNAYLEFNFP
jgi:hypothetical protein